jgi:hypothetical protein
MTVRKIGPIPLPIIPLPNPGANSLANQKRPGLNFRVQKNGKFAWRKPDAEIAAKLQASIG